MIRDYLKYEYNARELNAESKARRLVNIDSFSKLDRSEPLAFKKVERLLFICETSNHEKIYIRYPGKEAAREKNKRPLDFRPVLLLSNGEWMKDLSFGDIWDDITDLHKADNETICELASIFFRMAYMIDYKLVTETLSYEDIDISASKVVSTGEENLEIYTLNLKNEVLDELSKKIGLIRGASLEAYLIYNELLVQNEDCKYYYRSLHDEPKKDWNPKNGRINTMLSHLSVIEYLQGKITFSEITMRFQRGMGVAPIGNSEIEFVTDGLICKK